jgi:hypothetical protein
MVRTLSASLMKLCHKSTMFPRWQVGGLFARSFLELGKGFHHRSEASRGARTGGRFSHESPQTESESSISRRPTFLKTLTLFPNLIHTN